MRLLHHILDPQCLDTPDPCDPLIEIARDPGIDLTDLTASRHDFFLKIQDDHSGGGHHDQNI